MKIPLIFFCCLLLAGCELSYYWQATRGHLDLLQGKQEIQSLLLDNTTDPELKKKFQLLSEVRSFASTELNLPSGNGYKSYVELPNSYVSVLVSAAPPFSLHPKQWCYLIIGCQGYRGYFDIADAEQLANELRENGFDVSLSYASAYSTLGYLNQSWLPDYFSDPVLSTFLQRSDRELIATLIHEMAHQVVYVAGDTSFNESYATFVEQEGTLQYLRASNLGDEMEQIRQNYEDRLLFRSWIDETIKELNDLYGSSLNEDKKRLQKQLIFEQLKQRYQQNQSQFKLLNYSRWFAQDLNNSHLLGVKRYHNFVPAFEELFKSAESNWKDFHTKVEELAQLPKEERDKLLNQLILSKVN
ncbi:MAG TPA: aminopeptidase [Deltaproteobacteria bacterium]|nr:MAG: aminopeptidase [Pseudomonadota bacterium]HBM53839.1 aminopeptidase [Deltaproteobacteria bacterium]|tara:strand:- start:2095 stop:3165 length:1071 start_codon:yes stop_codon:yes gene_type:complete